MITINERSSDVIVTSPILSFLWLEVTGKCNLACEHCYAGSSPKGSHGRMQPHHWERVIIEAAEMGCKSLQFIGGEPTVYPFLNQLIRLATELEMGVEVYTNLVSMKEVHWETFKSCNVRVATSFYSCHSDVHERITNGKQSFHKTVGNIQQAIQLGLPLRVGLIEMHDDQDIEATERFLRDLGVERIGKDQVRSVGRGSNLIQVAQPEEALCGACAQGKAAVVPSGEVFPCVFSRWLSLGNVCQQSFSEIIAGNTTIAARQKLHVFFIKKFPERFVERRTTDDCEPEKGSYSLNKNCMPDTANYLVTQNLSAVITHVPSTGECEPFCEPWECSPDIPACQPDSLCIPDFKDPCSPATPCSPDKEQCHPDWDPPKKEISAYLETPVYCFGESRNLAD